jgi:hypothetical protein
MKNQIDWEHEGEWQHDWRGLLVSTLIAVALFCFIAYQLKKAQREISTPEPVGTVAPRGPLRANIESSVTLAPSAQDSPKASWHSLTPAAPAITPLCASTNAGQ